MSTTPYKRIPQSRQIPAAIRPAPRTSRAGRAIVVFCLLFSGLVFWVVVGGSGSTFQQIVVAGLVTWYAALYWAKYLEHPGDWMEADIIFLTMAGLYMILPYFLAAFIPDAGHPEYLDDRCLLCIAIALLAMTIGLLTPFGKKFAATLPRMDSIWVPERARFLSTVLFIIGVALVCVLIYSIGLGNFLYSRYVDAYQAEDGKGHLVMGVYLVELALFIYYMVSVQYKKKEPILPYVFYGIFALFIFRIGRRRLALEALLALLTLRHFIYKPLKSRTLIILVLALVPIVAFVGVARGYLTQGMQGMIDLAKYDFSFRDLQHSFDDTNTVPLSLLVTTQTIPRIEPYRYGSTLGAAVLNMIPQIIWSHRPQIPNQWMAWTYDARTASAGGGFAFSPIAEGYMNFGYIGVFLFVWALTMFIRAMVEFRRSRPQSQGRNLLYAVLMSMSFLFFRADIAGILKAFSFMVPAFLAAFWLGRTPKVAFDRALKPFERTLPPAPVRAPRPAMQHRRMFRRMHPVGPMPQRRPDS